MKCLTIVLLGGLGPSVWRQFVVTRFGPAWFTDYPEQHGRHVDWHIGGHKAARRP